MGDAAALAAAEAGRDIEDDDSEFGSTLPDIDIDIDTENDIESDLEDINCDIEDGNDLFYDENGNLCKYDKNGNQIWYNPNTDSWQNWNLTDPFDDKNYDKDGNWQGDYKLASLLEDGSFYASVFPDPVGILKGSGNYFKSVYRGFKTFIGIAGLLGEKRQNEINDNILIVSTIMIGAGKLSKITTEYKGVIEYLVKNHFDEIATFTKNMITKNSAELVGTIGTAVGVNQLVKNVGVKGPGVALSTLDLRMWGNAIHIADQIRPYIPSSVMDAIRDGSLFKQ